MGGTDAYIFDMILGYEWNYSRAYKGESKRC